MYYSIAELCPRTDIDMGRHGFYINLHPKWRNLVAASKLTQKEVNYVINNQGNAWLDACGYGRLYADFENEGVAVVTSRLYESRHCLRVSWGEWGPEHITVPGNGCGLDLDTMCGNPFGMQGKALLPHNIDSWSQKQLFLIIFTWIAETMVVKCYDKIWKGEL